MKPNSMIHCNINIMCIITVKTSDDIQKIQGISGKYETHAYMQPLLQFQHVT